MSGDVVQLVAFVFVVAAVMAIFMIVAFNFGFNKGIEAVVEIDFDEPEEEKPYKLILPNKQEKKDENEITEFDDEETKVQKLRKKIEDEKVNKFFD